MKEIIPFIAVRRAFKAIEFYKDVFGAELQGEVTMLQNIKGYEDEKYKDMIGHSTIQIGSSRIFLNDVIDDQPLVPGERIQLVLNFETEEELRTAFEKLENSGLVVSKLQEVFWGALFGTVKDKFGIIWQMYYGHK